MSQTQFSVSWSAYEKNICNGLSSLQQRGEFVDMTLAADGHLVRVHRMVLSLVSPYIKELIASADCPHPVIFLNQISYKTLSAVLEYIYTGEVNVTRDDLAEFVQAGKALHIKGLEDMDIKESTPSNKIVSAIQHQGIHSNENTDTKYNTDTFESTSSNAQVTEEYTIEHLDEDIVDNAYDDIVMEPDSNEITKPEPEYATNTIFKKTTTNNSLIQYTLSNHGNLQMILNRYMYSLKYTCKSGNRRWQCVYNSYKCPASVCTKNDKIVSRSGSHNHPFHDGKILKKVRVGAVFSTIKDVDTQATIMKKVKRESNQARNNDSDE